MKKLAKIVFAIILSFPLMFGGIFAIFSSQISQNSKILSWGGGSPLISNNSDDYPQEADAYDGSYTYKLFDDYYNDNNVSADTITTADFSGSGTKDSPYQVNSSVGFWYMAKFVSLKNQYVELNCDVILNDETFDNEGNVSGGDGVVYSWAKLSSRMTGMYFNGNGHTIYGFYYSSSSTNSVSLLGNTTVNELKNLNMDNSYMCCGNYCGMMVVEVGTIENCHNLGGYMNGKISGGLAYCVNESIKNCSSNINIYGSYNAGIIYQVKIVDAVLENLTNYGNVYSEDSDVYGIVYSRVYSNGTLILRNCINYGEIISGSKYSTYISGICYTATTVENCTNYGIIVYNGDGSNASYISGICYSATTLEGCKNYGSITSDNSSYYINANGICYTAEIIENCENHGEINNGKANGICYSVTTLEDCANYGNVNGNCGSSNIAYANGICHTATMVKNSENNGTINANSGTNSAYANGICNLVTTIESCKNFEKVAASGTSQGDSAGNYYVTANGICNTATTVENCINEGYIFANDKSCSSHSGSRVSGICYTSTIVQNCINYGEISGSGMVASYASGISYTATTIQTCINYGKIFACANIECGANGICYTVTTLHCCKNYGSIEADKQNKSFATNLKIYLSTLVNYLKNDAYIIDCYSYSMANIPVIASVREKSHVEINGLEIEYNIDGDYTKGILSNTDTTAEVNIRNVSLNVKCQNYEATLFKQINLAKNIFVDIDCTSTKSSDNYLCENTDYSANGVVININSSTGSIKQYYGTNFAGFYTSWRTGEIGISAIDGTGVFQNKIDETWLQNNGFTKKS